MKNISLLMILLTLSACGKKTHHKSKTQETVTPPVLRELEVTQKETVTFLRKEQMVSRYDCGGKVTSRRIETLNTLSKKITIEYENRKKAWSYFVLNRTTNSRNKGAFSDNGNFVIDYAPTVFNMKVKEGINDVEYVFNRCTEIGKDPSGQPTCKGKTEVEKEGLVQIDVYYSSELVPGEQHVRPSAESCTKS